MAKGFKAQNYRGKVIAIEQHPDGSVTICKELAAEIASNALVPDFVREYFKPHKTEMKFVNDYYVSINSIQKST